MTQISESADSGSALSALHSQSPNPIMMAVKLQYVEEVANGFENTAIFRLACHVNIDKQFNPDDLFAQVKKRLFPKGIDKHIVYGYDYLVLRTEVDGAEIHLMPGTILYVRENGHVGVITVSDGVPDVEIHNGKLIVG